MKTLIITDTETTGLDPATCHTIEVAVIVWDVASATALSSFSSLIHATANPAESINRIGAAALARAPLAPVVWRRVLGILRDVEGPAAFVAHRAEFDRGFYPSELAARFPWLCSKFDIEWPSSRLGASCVEMALAHGVPVVSAHRALTDCTLIARTLEAVHAAGHDLPAMLARAMRPKAVFAVADTSFDEARNALAKAAGFRWEKPFWTRSMAIADAALLPFEVRQVSP